MEQLLPKNKRRKISSPTKQKILLLLAAGVALGFRPTIGGQLRVLKEISREWKTIDRQHLYRIVSEFKYDRLVEMAEQHDGTIRIVLSEEGKYKIREFNVDHLQLKKLKIWDKVWRVVFFDVPEKRRRIRDALREKLVQMGFFELQKSVFIHPFPCLDEIEFIVEFLDARPYVRYGELRNLTNEAEVKLHFDLS